jgi:phosphatidyl-myo-inositol alpha-mannosyltransferase
MKVGLVSPYDLSVPGGVQAQVLGLASYLKRAGDEPVVIGPGLPAGIAGVDLGSSLSIPGNRSRVPLSFDPRVGGRIRAIAGDLDVLHVHEPLMPLISLLSTHTGTPVVATFHADPGRLGRSVYRFIDGLLPRLLGDTRIMTAVSETAASVLAGRTKQVAIIPNGIDVQSFEGARERIPGRVSFLGRDEPRKGLDVLLGAWPFVKSAFPDAELLVIGSDRDTPGVRWMGRVDEEVKCDILASSSIFVAPQLGGESFGIVIAEAMAAGAAVVASDLVPFRSVGGDAIRFFTTGSPNALADAVTGLLQDPDELGRLSQLGAARAKAFDWEVVGSMYRSVYLRAIT